MKENLFKFLFGDKPRPEKTPEILFADEWQRKKNSIEENLCYRMAHLIIELVPERYWKDGCEVYKISEGIMSKIQWEHREILSALAEIDPEPLKTQDEFIRFLCKQILEEQKGGAK